MSVRSCPSGQYDPFMGDEGDADYDAALAGEPTELAPSESGTEAHTAWALDESPEWKPPFWTAGRITAVVVSGAVVAAIVVAGFAGYHLRGETPVVPAASPPAPLPPQPVAPAPETHGWGIPTTITPPPINPDRVFIANLQGYGWNVPDPVLMVQRAKRVCDGLALGQSQEDAIRALLRSANPGTVVLTQADMNRGRAFVVAAMDAYPNCG